MTPLNEARKRELLGVARKGISDIDRIARSLGFEANASVDLLVVRSGLFSSRSSGVVKRTRRLPEEAIEAAY